MSNLKNKRLSAYNRQQGKCCYCGFLMWIDTPDKFALDHRLSLDQAKHFQCTAEHLTARQDGGDNSSANIAAACSRCNRLRHTRKYPLDPIGYQKRVQMKLDKGRWLTLPTKASLVRGKVVQLSL
ncbi:HNH endonuclease [Pseudomonas sp.]|uniref:HNH endonuclease n=1 Tax=Pseudomonas sp. TaxID=306 RepID=UPI003A969190